MKYIFAAFLCVASIAVAQTRVDTWVSHKPMGAEFAPLSDGGVEASGCVTGLNQSGEVRNFCSNPFQGRTVAQRTALAECLEYGRRIAVREFKLADGGL